MPALWSLLPSSNTCEGSPFAWLLGIHTRGMVPPWSCPSQWENSTPMESFVTELLRRQVQRQLPARSAHHCNATRLVVTTNNSALPLSQPQSKTWPELPRFIPETPYFMEKDPGAQAVQMIFQICQEVQSVGSNPGPGLWNPVSFPWPLPSPFYFVVESSGRGRKVWSLGRTLTGKLCKFSCDGPSCLGKPFQSVCPLASLVVGEINIISSLTVRVNESKTSYSAFSSMCKVGIEIRLSLKGGHYSMLGRQGWPNQEGDTQSCFLVLFPFLPTSSICFIQKLQGSPIYRYWCREDSCQKKGNWR